MAISAEGLCAIEVHAAYGWESRDVLSLEYSQVVCGGDRHHSVGRYFQSYRSHYLGEPLTVFGEKKTELAIEIQGQLNGGSITTVIVRLDNSALNLKAGITRMAEAAFTALGGYISSSMVQLS